MTPTSSQNQIRQVIVNELGLTRESVRDEMRAFIEQTMATYFKSDQFQQVLQRILVARINEQISIYRGEKKLLALITEAVSKQVQQQAMDFVNAHVRVALSVEEESGKA